MSILLKKLLWFPTGESLKPTYNITDLISFDSGNGLDIQNNVLTITLKNSMDSVHPLGSLLNSPFSKYISYKGQQNPPVLAFNEQDLFKLYLKYTDDASDLTSVGWKSDNESDTTAPDDDYLIGAYYLKDIQFNNQDKNAYIKLVCVDRTYILFNKVFSGSYSADTSGTTTSGTTYTTNNFIKYLLKRNSETNATKNEPYFTDSAFYSLDIRDDTNISPTLGAGGIQSKRNDNSDFPKVDMVKVWKPLYEWISELSQVQYINTATELENNNLLYNKPFIFYVDEYNKVHWYEMNSTATDTYVVGIDAIYQLQLKKSVLDVVNMIIFNCGLDMDKHGILHFALNESSNIKGLKMRYVPMTTISKGYIDNDIKNFNKTRVSGTYPQYPSTYGTSGLTTAWSTIRDIDEPQAPLGKATNNLTYNRTLRQACKRKGLDRATVMLNVSADPRWNGSMTIKGEKISPGTLINLTDTRLGLYLQPIRINDVKHAVNKNSWVTVIDIEEDVKEVFGVSG